MLLVFGLWAPRYYVTLLVKGGMGGASALALVGLAFFIVRMLDICIDPLVAIAMDRTRTPIGRYRPWLILGLIRERMTDDQRAAMTAHMPPPLRCSATTWRRPWSPALTAMAAR